MGYALRRIRLLCWGGKFAVQCVAMLPWNRRQVCYGISGKFGVELVATFIWNWWQLSRGIRTIVREECRKSGVDILQGHISPGPVHVMIAISPHVTISRLIQRMQGKSSYRLLAEFPHCVFHAKPGSWPLYVMWWK